MSAAGVKAVESALIVDERPIFGNEKEQEEIGKFGWSLPIVKPEHG